jgi:glycosyltransferase involved in cell wall biosynthesis
MSHYHLLPSRTKMNICLVTSSFPAHPADVVQAPFLVDFIEELKKRGHRVFVFTQDRKGERQEFLKEVQVTWFPWMGSRKPLVGLNPFHPVDGLRMVTLIRNGKRFLISFLKENRIDACLAMWFLPSGYFANAAYRRTGIPYSVWALGSDIYKYGQNPLVYPVMKRIAREARGVFADGFDLARRVEGRFGRPCSFLASGRRVEAPEPERLNQPEKPGKSYQFLFVGRLEGVKGVDLLLRAADLLKEENLDFHLIIVGKGGLEKWVIDFVAEKELGDRVSLPGNVSDSTLGQLYNSADCVVIPSRSESIPLVFSEALRFDRELIVADVGDLGMLGRRYGVAQVVPPENVSSLKEEMKRKIEVGRRTEGEREKGKREELLRWFSVETSVERFLADFTRQLQK